MAYKAVVIHRMDDNNVGDMSADPLQYFLKEDQYHKIDITKIGQEPFPDDVPIIYGGGGLLANEFFGNKINLMFSQPDVMQLENLWEHRWFLRNKKWPLSMPLRAVMQRASRQRASTRMRYFGTPASAFQASRPQATPRNN